MLLHVVPQFVSDEENIISKHFQVKSHFFSHYPKNNFRLYGTTCTPTTDSENNYFGSLEFKKVFFGLKSLVSSLRILIGLFVWLKVLQFSSFDLFYH